PMPDTHTVAGLSRRILTRGWTVSELARRFRVGEDRIRGWIKRGEMIALNVAEVKRGRPRFVVNTEEDERFEQGRWVAAPAKPAPRHKRRPAGQVDFFPGD